MAVQKRSAWYRYKIYRVIVIAPVISLELDGLLLTGQAWNFPINGAAHQLVQRDPEVAARTTVPIRQSTRAAGTPMMPSETRVVATVNASQRSK